MTSNLLKSIIEQSEFDIEFSEVNEIDIDEAIAKLEDNEEMVSTMETVMHAFNCYKIDRFIPAKNEKRLEEKAADLHGNGSFLAGLVFMQENDTQFPKHVQYKIRMNKDLVPSSKDLKTRYFYLFFVLNA